MGTNNLSVRHSALKFLLGSGFFFLFGAMRVWAQSDTLTYLVLFSDKNNTPYSLQQPEEFLSNKALLRRQKEGIALDELDLPVNPNYVEELSNVNGLNIRYTSKWLNGAVISFNSPTVLDDVADLNFTTLSLPLRSTTDHGVGKNLLPEQTERTSPLPVVEDGNIYGQSFGQIAVHRGQLLHEAGFRGEGVLIGVLDAGFNDTDELSAFSKLYEESRVIGTHDFVDGDANVYHGSSHGTYVLSTMAGYIPDSLIGTAPFANYMLFRTEDSSSESPIEECNWIAAAEMADSAGVDLITTSLGYSTFDNEALNYLPSEMDGETAIITRGTRIAASRGILVLNSAGNKGNSDWNIITAPADADNILAVGAVRADSVHASFSSFGPSADGRIKPEVSAVGFQSTYADLDGGVSKGNGTSFACPILAGLSACLIQAHPNESSQSLRNAIVESAHLFYTPNDSLGYGIPNMWEAHIKLSPFFSSNTEQLQVQVYPNPFREYLTLVIENSENEDLIVEIFDINGRLLEQPVNFVSSGRSNTRTIQLGDLSDGYYLIRVKNNSSTTVRTIQKISQ